MIYPNAKKTEVLKTDEAVGYLLAGTDNNDIVELHIHKNGEIPAHSLPIDVTFYVASGRGSITIVNEKVDTLKGDIIDVKKDLDRAWQNLHDESLILLVIKQKK